MRSFIIIFFSVLALFSCVDSKKKDTIALLQEWEGKRVNFPSNPVFTIQGEDTLDYYIQNTCKILTYIDTTGCTSCKLRLTEWQKFIAAVDSIQPHSVQFLFFLYPQNRMEIYQTLRAERFNYPICIDEKDSLNKLNHFPSEMAFQTFLLDKDNKVVAIGNPIHNPKVKELYFKIIRGDEIIREDNSRTVKTELNIDKTSVRFGSFDWQEEQKITFSLENIGDKPLVIEDVHTSCGCTTVEFEKEPVRPGVSLDLHVTYKAEHPEHFNKTITVHCNVESSPIKLTISGNAE